MKAILALIAILALAFWVGGFHIVYKRPDWQLFGCKETYINAKGENTGECQ